MNTTTKLKLDKWMLGLVAVSLLAACCYLTTPSQAENRHRQPPACVYAQFRGTLGPPVTNTFGVTKEQVGLELAWISRSSTAPEIPIGYPAAQAVAFLIESGYQVQWLTHDRIVGVR